MTVTIAKTQDLTACLTLRRTVFINEQNVPEDEERDEYDAGALHFLAMDDGLPVATARVVQVGNVGKIGRVCVLKSHRGTGLGADLMGAVLAELRRAPGLKIARLGAQTYALGFYEKLGFRAYGPEYLDAGIAHYDMELRL